MKNRNITPLTLILISVLFLCVSCDDQEDPGTINNVQNFTFSLGDEFGPYAGLPVISIDSPQNSYNLLKNVPKYNGDINVLFMNSQLSRWDNSKVLKLLKENHKLLPQLLSASQKMYCCPPRTRHWDDLRPHTISWRVISRLVSLNAEYFLRNEQHEDGVALLCANARLASAMLCYPADTLDLVVISSVVKMQLEVLYRLYKAGWINKRECASVAAYLPDEIVCREALPYVMAGKYAAGKDLVSLILDEKKGVLPVHLFDDEKMALLKKINKEKFVEALTLEMKYITETMEKKAGYTFDAARYPDAGDPEKFLLATTFYYYPAIINRLQDNNAKVEAMRNLARNTARQDSANTKNQEYKPVKTQSPHAEKQGRFQVSQ